MLYRQLEDIGLSEAEARIYLAALELGQAGITRISEKSGIKRTTCYHSFGSLKDKGLLSIVRKRGRVEYYAEDPRLLEKMMEERKQKLSGFMPQLLSYANFIDRKPDIRYFEGDKGLHEVEEDALNYPGQEILAWFSNSYFGNEEEEYLNNFYIPERKKRRISVRTIMPDNSMTRKFMANDLKELRQTKVFPENLFSIDIEIMIYGPDKVAILSFDEKISLIITSPKIHASLKSIFETMWVSSLN